MTITLKKGINTKALYPYKVTIYDKLYSIQIMYHLFVLFANQWSIFFDCV